MDPKQTNEGTHRVSRGEEADFQRELIALIPQMRAMARALCRERSEAEDLAQTALEKAWEHRSSFEAGTNMKAWVFTIIRNRFYSDRRRAWRAPIVPGEMAETTLIAVDDPQAALHLDDLRTALQAIPDALREAVILVGAGGLSYEEAADILQVAVGTVKSRVSRARARLHRLLEGVDAEAGGVGTDRADEYIGAESGTMAG